MKKGNIIELLNASNHIIAEVKNKYNTVSRGKLAALYWALEGTVMDTTSVYKNFTACHVSIILHSPPRRNKEFTPSDCKKVQKCPANPLIRHIDGASFYELVTGGINAFENLIDIFPTVISEVTNSNLPDRQRL